MIRVFCLSTLLLCSGLWVGCGGGNSSASGPSGKLAFAGSSQTLMAGACSQAVQVQSEDNSGNVTAATSDVTVALSSSSATGGLVSFYSDSACTQRIKSTVIKAAASSSSSIYFLRNVASNSALSITATDPANQYSTGSQNVTITRNPTLTTAFDSPHLPTGLSTGVINVKTYCKEGIYQTAGATCAVGDGSTDDTQAIMDAVRFNVGATSARASNPTSSRDSVIYFPSGTYLISKPILWQDGSGNWVGFLSFQGENNSDTILKFVDGT